MRSLKRIAGGAPSWAIDDFPTVDGVRNTVRILSRIDPKFSKLKAEELVDESIVRKLEREGVFKQTADVINRQAVWFTVIAGWKGMGGC